MYQNKEIDHEKRKTGTGSYSPYNWIYHYLLDNFETNQQIPEDVLQKEYKAYCIKCRIAYSKEQAKHDIDKAITNFRENDGKHGDTAHNLGKKQDSSLDNIKNSISDLRW